MLLKEFIKKFTTAKEEFKAALIINPKNIYYFTRFFPHSPSYLFITEHEISRLLVPELEYQDAVEKSKDVEVVKIPGTEKQLEFLCKNILESDKIDNLGFENEFMTVSTYSTLNEKLKSLKLLNMTDLLNSIREIKTPEEIKSLEKSAQIADLGMKTAIDSIEVGVTEKEVAAELEYAMRKAGSEKIPFDSIVASGPNSALPHATTSERRINDGDLIIIDIGATYNGYCSDISRTVCAGDPSQKQLEIYKIVLQAHQEAKKFARAGVKIKEIDEIAIKILKDAGYEFIHSLGHGLGLDVHENPVLSFKNDKLLKEHSVITIEPGIYIANFGGVRIEDDYQVLKDGLKNLTKIEQELIN